MTNLEIIKDYVKLYLTSSMKISRITFRIKKSDASKGYYISEGNNYYYMGTEEVVGRRSFNGYIRDFDNANNFLIKFAKSLNNEDSFNFALRDYSPEIQYPLDSTIGDLTEFLFDLAAGVTLYSGERSPSDGVALENIDRATLAMVEHFYLSNKCEYGTVAPEDLFNLYWRQSRLRAFIYSHIKTIIDPSGLKGGASLAVDKGSRLLRRARDGYEIPPSALTLWLCMSPREAFDTAEGRAKWDRLYEQCQAEEAERRVQESDEVLRNVYGKDGRGPYPENHWSSRIIKGEQDFLPATPYPQSLFQVVLPKLTPV